ncbi:MAG: hypothetical protein HKL95_10885 [Phycisphaerae bacterium]|nr:hypothetical protein [Phycisphaerae bacterium]
MFIDIAVLQEYLDGELSAQARAQVEAQVALDPTLAALVDKLRKEQELRRQVWESYLPAEHEAHHLATDCLAQLRAQAYAPLKVSFATAGVGRELRRAALAAACLLIGVGGYVAGRASSRAATTAANASRSTQYVVRIEMPGGESVSQTFTDYAAAQKFARGYLADHGSTAQSGTQQVAALQPQGVF